MHFVVGKVSDWVHAYFGPIPALPKSERAFLEKLVFQSESKAERIQKLQSRGYEIVSRTNEDLYQKWHELPHGYGPWWFDSLTDEWWIENVEHCRERYVLPWVGSPDNTSHDDPKSWELSVLTDRTGKPIDLYFFCWNGQGKHNCERREAKS